MPNDSLEPAYVLSERPVAFFWTGGRSNTMIGLWLGTSSPNAMRLQVAFRMRPNAVLASAEVLQAAGVQPLDFHAQPTQEPSVIMDASVLFDDQDGHLLECLAALPHEARPDTGVVPYSE